MKRYTVILAMLAVFFVIVGIADVAQGSFSTAVYKTNGGDKLVVASGGEIDIESGGSLKIAGTAITSNATELNWLDGLTAGVATASKAVVLGASKNLDDLVLGKLKLTPTDTVPATSEGQIYWDDSENALKVYDGSSWLALSVGTGDNTLDAAYDEGGAGSGRTITVDSGAVVLTTTAADNNNVLEVTKNPGGAQSGAGIVVTMGGNATGAGLSFANTGSGNDVLGSGSTWNVSKAGAATFASVTATTGTYTTLYQSAILAAAAGNVNLTIDAAGNGTITFAGTSTGNTIFTRQVNLNGDVNIGNAATDTLTITSIIDSDITLDDGAGASPSFILKDATNETATFSKTDAGFVSINTQADDGFKILTGNLWVGNGSPGTAAMDGEDLYVEGASEFDGAVQFDGAVTAAGGITSNIFTGSTTVDEGSKISRNQAITTTVLLEVETTHADDDRSALLVDHNATGAVDAAQIENAGTAAGLHITGGAAGSVGVHVDVANSATARVFFADVGPWLGTTGQGVFDIVSDSAATVPAGQFLRLNQQGTGQHAAAIDGSVIYINDDATAPAAGTSYAVSINAANIEALNVASGIAVFAEQSTHTAGINADGDLDIDFSVNTEEADITTSVTDYAADSAVFTVYASGAGATNNTYLLRLRHFANGDAQDHFAVFEDNDGAVMWKVDSGGAMTVAGTATFTGTITANGAITGDGGAALSGMLKTVTDDVDGKTVTIAESGTAQTNSGAVGGGIYNLPEASTAIGMYYTFVVMAAQNMDINPDNGDQIRGLTDAAGDAIRNATVGSTVTILCVDATNWVVVSSYGTWTDVN